MLEDAKKAAATLPVTRDELVALMKRCDPSFFLASISRAALYVGLDHTGKVVKSSGSWSKKLQQYHIELAQAMYLTIPASELSLAPCHPSHIQAISDKLFDLCEEFKSARYAETEHLRTAEERELLLLQERIRLHTLTVRNWAYYSQCKRTLAELLGPLDKECERLVGLTGTKLIQLFDVILRSIETHSNVDTQKLSVVWSKSSKREISQEYVKQYGLDPDQVEALILIAHERRWGKRQLLAFLLSHSSLLAPQAHTFEITELAKLLSVAPDSLGQATNELSLAFGSLSTINLDHLFLANPVWERPLISAGQGRYLCFLPQLFFAFSFSILSSIFDKNKEGQALFSARRAKYLEDAIREAFSGAFGAQVAEPNVKWSYDGIGYETDLLVQVDTQLFIIEAKSHKISWPALRGAPDRLRKHIEEVLLGPAIQSKRLEDAIWEWLRDDKSRLDLKSKIDLSAVREITRLSVTLEDFASIQSNLKDVSRAGLVPDDSAMAVTMSLSDLQSIFEILDNPVERMFYLKRRKELQETGMYVADELDLLGLYLGTGLDLDPVESSEVHLTAIGMSEKVDEYFQARDQGYDPPKPVRRMTPWFAAMRDRLAEKRPPRWTEAALVLLGVPYEMQCEVAANFERVKRNVLAVSEDASDIENTVIVIPPKSRDIGLACVALRDSERDRRHVVMQGGSTGVFLNSKASRCLVIGCDARGLIFPYASLVVFDRASASVTT